MLCEQFSSLPHRAHEALRNAGRRGTSIVFAVMITVLLVALIFAANENDIIGWILVVIAGGWLLLATVVVTAFSAARRSSAKQSTPPGQTSQLSAVPDPVALQWWMRTPTPGI